MNKKERLEQFIKERNRKKDWASYVSNDGLSLVKQRIAKECAFPRSTLYQDKAIIQTFSQLETKLKGSGILKVEDADVAHYTDHEVAVEVRLSDFSLRLDMLQMRMHALSKLIDDSRRFGLKSNGE